jgi:hypothetical protein
MVKWTNLRRPKEFGELGFAETRIRNICLLSKWIYKLENGASDLSCQILRNKYVREVVSINLMKMVVLNSGKGCTKYGLRGFQIYSA